MIRDGYEDEDVTNFDISENVTIFELGNGQFWWSGSHRAYKPEKLELNNDSKIKLFAAGYKCYMLVSEQNTVHV